MEMVFDIQIGKFKVNSLMSCEVRKSCNELSDTATIRLPGMAYNAALEVESKIKRGDSVVIKLGYDDQLFQELDGYVSTIATDNVIEIMCEDAMFLMRKAVKNKQYKNISACDIIKDVVSQIGNFEIVKGAGVDDMKYDKFTVSDATAYDVLKKIKEETGLHIFMKKHVLNVHLKYTYKEGSIVHDFSKNVEHSNLKYLKAEDKRVQVEVVGIDRKSKKVNILVGDQSGDKITVHRYNVSDEKALKVIGLEELKKHRFTGFEGEITGWLLPYYSYGYSDRIINDDYPDREGVYYVESTVTLFNENGGVRTGTLGLKLA